MQADLKIEKSLTISNGNFGSIKPTVSLTIKDVEVNNIADVYAKTSVIVENMLYLEAIQLGEESNTANTIGLKKYISEMSKNKDNIFNELRAVVRSV